MFRLLGTAVFVCAAAYAASIPQKIQGNYIEARTADVYTGACIANGEVGQVGQNAVMGWNITAGRWDGVDLSGLSVVGVLLASHTLGDVYQSAYPVKSVLIVDSRAGALERLALQSFAKSMAGDLLQNVVQVDYQPVKFQIKGSSIHDAAASLNAGTEAVIETRALEHADGLCHNEEVWYPPLVKVSHAMPAYTLTHSFQGAGLGTTWKNPFKRSAFVGTFEVPSE
ncbi:MAG TPA: DUF1326 domain-containing protein [Bryobacteraceae bacterium]|nr:DUF1326 domain-containing protein [Bryobacteraceae bacterium]